jgi:hypothetical protein
MANPVGESSEGILRLDFDRRLMLQFCGSVLTSDAGLFVHRELDDALGLSVMAGEALADTRTGKNGRPALVGMFRQSVFGRLDGSLTSLKEKLIKIGAKVVGHGRYVAFQMAKVAIPRALFADILRLIAELRPPLDPVPA